MTHEGSLGRYVVVLGLSWQAAVNADATTLTHREQTTTHVLRSFLGLVRGAGCGQCRSHHTVQPNVLDQMNGHDPLVKFVKQGECVQLGFYLRSKSLVKG